MKNKLIVLLSIVVVAVLAKLPSAIGSEKPYKVSQEEKGRPIYEKNC